MISSRGRVAMSLWMYRRPMGRWMASAVPVRPTTRPFSASDDASFTPPRVTPTKAVQPTVHIGTTIVAPAPEGDGEEDEEVFENKQKMPVREKEQELMHQQTQVATLYKEGRYQQGLPVAEDTFQAMRDHFGISHPATASSALNLGLFHKQLGNFDEAQLHYQTALEAYRDTVGTDHASYAMVLHNLGILLQAQVHFDTTLSLTDRLARTEQALEYLERALKIRTVELPKDHPHVVATQSALGITLTAHILHQHKPVFANNNNNNNQKKVVPTAARYRSVLPPGVTTQSWEAAEDHLRRALDKALRNPKGDSSLSRKDKNHYLNLQKKQSLHQKHNNTTKDQEIILLAPMQTTMAATAAQNLAVFLKVHSTTLETDTPLYRALVKEAQNLYQDALQIRVALLPKGHPDIYVTQYSLAELYEHTGQTKLAQALRQTILDTYEPPPQQPQQQNQQPPPQPQQKQSKK